jgi:NADPH:quinone reductase-like Zn-dependent oxidoreductase
MRAIRFHHFGPPAEALQLDDLPEETPGPGQVRLRLTHRPINPSDLLTISGHYGRLPRLPAVAGLEGVGRVAALGEGVAGWRVGDRAIPLGAGGTWRESAAVAAAQLLPVPDAVSDEVAAQFVVNPVTAWVMLEEELGLRPGDWLAQTAAGSALGRLVIQLARLRGYHTVNFVRRADAVAELRDLGADAVFSTDEAPDVGDLVARVRALTDGRGVAGALDAVGGETGALALHCLRPGGTLLVYGLLGGEPLPLHNGEMLFRGLTVRGFWLTHWFQHTPPERAQTTLRELMGLMAGGQLAPTVEAAYDLADFRAAVTHAQRSGRQGKIMLTG